MLALLLLTACGTPPHKEMDQAQGAIDAARAAGADRYAPDEYSEAVQSLQLANDAVGQRDYRLALSHALESREHAQNAARDAAVARARRRGDVERARAEIDALLAQAQGRLATVEKSRVPRRTVADLQQVLAAVTDDLQEAGATVEAEDYDAAQTALERIKARIAELIARLDETLNAQSVRRRR